MNSVYYNTAALYKVKKYKKRPSYGYGRSDEYDYYDDYYDNKHMERYDKEVGKYESDDREYYRRRRPAGQGRVSHILHSTYHGMGINHISNEKTFV